MSGDFNTESIRIKTKDFRKIIEKAHVTARDIIE